LNPTVRRYEALRDNPVLGSQTHALYGMAGSQQPGYSWESPERFKKHLASMSGVKTGALHGRSSGVSASNGLVDGLADMLKGMIFGSSTWPMTKFYFYVLIGGIELGFQTVEGLEAEIGVIEYRDGDSPLLAKERIPGLVTYNKVTLKKGMFANDTSAAGLFKEIATDRQYTKRRSILIAMLDHNHIPQFIWRYEGCFITKFTPANLDAESESEIAVEEMEFAGRSFTTETLMGMAAGLVGGALSGSVSLPF
jgi:phage tail-like protein